DDTRQRPAAPRLLADQGGRRRPGEPTQILESLLAGRRQLPRRRPHMAGGIDDYVAALRRERAFDPGLARRLAPEVEDHRRDAAEADPAWPSVEAERRAVECFGLSREIAAQFAADAVDHQARRTWITLAATVVVTFIAMRLRTVWLDDATMPALAPLIDRYAFIGAMAVGAVGWLAFRHSWLSPHVST